MRNIFIATLLAGSVMACSSGNSPAQADTAVNDDVAANAAMGGDSAVALDAVLGSDVRKDDAGRDQYRHPKETLAFMQVEPDMTVAEYAPGGGWYTKVLAPYLAETGKYIALGTSPDNTPFSDEQKAKMATFGESFPAKVHDMTGIATDKIAAYTPLSAPADAAGTVDRILIFRMMHNLMRWGIAGSEIDAMAKLLKPGGMIGIVQHRAKADAPADYVDGSKGYLKQAELIKFMDDHGFELAGESEINANPNDTADYPNGVWTLPPTFALKDKDKAKYEAIGESDRMTLLFKKKA